MAVSKFNIGDSVRFCDDHEISIGNAFIFKIEYVYVVANTGDHYLYYRRFFRKVPGTPSIIKGFSKGYWTTNRLKSTRMVLIEKTWK